MKIVLTVTPSRNPDGSRACSNRGQLFDARLDENTPIVHRSPQPLLDAARVLLAAGADPATPIAMRHAGSDHDALRSTVGAAAKLTVKEGDKAPTFRPYDAGFLDRIRPPSGFLEDQARGGADNKENAPTG